MFSLSMPVRKMNPKAMQSVIIATSYLIVCAFQYRNCQREVSGIGPTDIIRSDGETNVFIPCPFPGPNAPTWKINDVYYDLSSLPTEYVPATSGLLISQIQKSMDQTTFQCIVPTGDYGLQSSSVGTLKVDEIIPDYELMKYYSFAVQTDRLPTFELDHQHLDFSAEYKTFAWTTPANTDPTCNVFELQSTTCSSNIGIGHWYAIEPSDRRITLKLDELWNVDTSEYYYFKFIANSSQSSIECLEIQPYLVFDRSETKEWKTAQEGFCIDIKPTGNPSIALPKDRDRTRDASNLKDCTCSLFTATDCNDLVNCYCAPETLYNETIKACRNSSKLCFTNLSVEMNNTLIFTFDTYSECDSVYPKSYREYNISFKIMIVLPNPPSNLEVDAKNGEVHFTSSLNNPVEISLDHYRVVITDSTKQEIFNEPVSKQSLTQNVNISVIVGDIFNRTICSPYNVTVQAINTFGHSDIFKMVDNHKMTSANMCSCLKSNVIVDLEAHLTKLTETDGILVVDVDCNQTQYKSFVQLGVSLKHQNAFVKNATYNCINEKPIYFRSVSCGKAYHITVYWTPPGEEDNGEIICPLHEDFTTIPCSNPPRPPASTKQRITIIVVSTTLSSVILCLLLIGIVVCAVYCICRKK